MLRHTIPKELFDYLKPQGVEKLKDVDETADYLWFVENEDGYECYKCQGSDVITVGVETYCIKVT